MSSTENEISTGRARIQLIAILLTFCFAFSSCGSAPSISTHVDYCAAPSAERVGTYSVEFEDTPEFLKPMLRDEVSVVLARKGLDYVEGDADAVLLMSFVNRTLEAGEAARDEAWETTAPGGGVRFVAEVNMEMTGTVTSEKIWAGSIARVHNVYEGSYMHEGPARAAMSSAFMTVFADYPSTTDGICD